MPTVDATHVLAPGERVALDRDTALWVDGIVVEAIEASPGDPPAYPAGAGVTLTVHAKRSWREDRATLSLLSDGYDGQASAWLDPYRVTLVRVDEPLSAAPRVGLVVERAAEVLSDAPPVSLRLDRDREVALAPEATVRLVRHGHKQTYGDTVSPLLVTLEYVVAGGPSEEQNLILGPERERLSWDWRDYRFTVNDYRYGEWMDVRVQRLALRRVEAAGR